MLELSENKIAECPTQHLLRIDYQPVNNFSNTYPDYSYTFRLESSISPQQSHVNKLYAAIANFQHNAGKFDFSRLFNLGDTFRPELTNLILFLQTCNVQLAADAYANHSSSENQDAPHGLAINNAQALLKAHKHQQSLLAQLLELIDTIGESYGNQMESFSQFLEENTQDSGTNGEAQAVWRKYYKKLAPEVLRLYRTRNTTQKLISGLESISDGLQYRLPAFRDDTIHPSMILLNMYDSIAPDSQDALQSVQRIVKILLARTKAKISQLGVSYPEGTIKLSHYSYKLAKYYKALNTNQTMTMAKITKQLWQHFVKMSNLDIELMPQSFASYVELLATEILLQKIQKLFAIDNLDDLAVVNKVAKHILTLDDASNLEYLSERAQNLQPVLQQMTHHQRQLLLYFLPSNIQSLVGFEQVWGYMKSDMHHVDFGSIEDMNLILCNHPPEVLVLESCENGFIPSQRHALIIPPAAWSPIIDYDLIGGEGVVSRGLWHKTKLFLERTASTSHYDKKTLDYMLNASIGSPSLHADANRLVWPERLIDYFLKHLSKKCSPQGWFMAPPRQLGCTAVPGADQALVINNENEIYLFEMSCFARFPTEILIEKNNLCEKQHLPLYDGTYRIRIGTPNEQSYVYTLPTDDNYVPNQGQFILQQESLSFLVSSYPLSHRQTILEQDWYYAISEKGVVFLHQHYIVTPEYIQASQILKEKYTLSHTQKGSFGEVIRKDTLGVHAAHIAMNSHQYRYEVGRLIAEQMSLNARLITTVVTTLLTINSNKMVSHQHTYIEGPNNPLLTYNNNIPVVLKNTDQATMKGMFARCIPNLDMPMKSRSSIFLASLLAISATASLYFLEMIIAAGIISGALVFSTLLLYKGNWLNYMHYCMKSHDKTAADLFVPKAQKPHTPHIVTTQPSADVNPNETVYNGL